MRKTCALIFDEACRRSGLSAVRLRELLRLHLDRSSLSPQTLKAWRNGTNAVPSEAMLCVLIVGRLTQRDVARLLLLRLEDVADRDVIDILLQAWPMLEQ